MKQLVGCHVGLHVGEFVQTGMSSSPYVEWLTKQLSGMADFYKGEDRPGIT